MSLGKSSKFGGKPLPLFTFTMIHSPIPTHPLQRLTLQTLIPKPRQTRLKLIRRPQTQNNTLDNALVPQITKTSQNRLLRDPRMRHDLIRISDLKLINHPKDLRVAAVLTRLIARWVPFPISVYYLLLCIYSITSAM